MIEKIPSQNELEHTKVLRRGEHTDIAHDNFSGAIDLELGGNNPSRLNILKVDELDKNEQGIPVYEGLMINPDRSYIVVSQADLDEKGSGIKGLKVGEKIQLGRSSDLPTNKVFSSLSENPYVSGSHLSIEVNEVGDISIHDSSTNGTEVRYRSVGTEDSRANEWLIDSNAAATKEASSPVEDHQQISPEDAKYLLRMERIFKFPEPKGRDKFGNSLDKRLEKSEEGEKAAAFAYRFVRDPKIKEIIKSGAGERWREEEMQDVLRDNNTVRLELGLYLLDKFNSMNRLPRRVMLDGEKNGSHVGYESGLSSREYSALLALSMLDGSFKPSNAKNDPIDIVYGDVERGQHRYAAAQLLGLENGPYATEYLNIKRNF